MYTIDKECEQRMICLKNHLNNHLGKDYRHKEPRFECVADGQIYFKIYEGVHTHYFIVDKELIDNYADGFDVADLLNECDGWADYQLVQGNEKIFDLNDECPYTDDQIEAFKDKMNKLKALDLMNDLNDQHDTQTPE